MTRSSTAAAAVAASAATAGAVSTLGNSSSTPTSASSGATSMPQLGSSSNHSPTNSTINSDCYKPNVQHLQGKLGVILVQSFFLLCYHHRFVFGLHLDDIAITVGNDW